MAMPFDATPQFQVCTPSPYRPTTTVGTAVSDARPWKEAVTEEMARILVVDDEPEVEMLFRQKFQYDLRAERFKMEFAQSGD